VQLEERRRRRRRRRRHRRRRRPRRWPRRRVRATRVGRPARAARPRAPPVGRWTRPVLLTMARVARHECRRMPLRRMTTFSWQWLSLARCTRGRGGRGLCTTPTRTRSMRAGRPTAALAVHTRRPSHASKPPSRRHHLRMPRARGPLLRAAAAARHDMPLPLELALRACLLRHERSKGTLERHSRELPRGKSGLASGCPRSGGTARPQRLLDLVRGRWLAVGQGVNTGPRLGRGIWSHPWRPAIAMGSWTARHGRKVCALHAVIHGERVGVAVWQRGGTAVRRSAEGDEWWCIG
jgi:hypothetical protein